MLSPKIYNNAVQGIHDLKMQNCNYSVVKNLVREQLQVHRLRDIKK